MGRLATSWFNGVLGSVLASKNLKAEAAALEKLWTPVVVGEVNNQYVKVAKVKGELTWHKHDDEDELFYILQGRLRIEYADTFVDLVEGDFHVVPKGQLHNPVCEEECLVALIESKSTKHTGEIVMDKTVRVEDQLASYINTNEKDV